LPTQLGWDSHNFVTMAIASQQSRLARQVVELADA
jgi:hypothetical protein